MTTRREQESRDETPVAGEQFAVETQKALNLQVAAIIIRELIKHEQLTPWQRDDYELLLGGHSSHGLWIYRRPDKTCYGINYDTLEDLEQGTIEEQAKRRHYPSDLNACAEFEKKLTDEETVSRYAANLGFQLIAGAKPETKPWRMWHATAEQRCRAFVATMEQKG